MKSLISLVSIVKNEEAILERMINSVKGIVDEFVIVDTGSSDSTKEIISKYQTVIEIPFVNYVETKNEAIKKATGEYILFMDADEVLYQGAEVLKEWAEGKNLEALSCKITEGGQDYGTTAMEYERIRMWRNDGSWKFEGPGVHEVIVGSNNIVYDGRVKVRHDHSGKSAANTDAAKFQMWKQLLFTYLKKEPKNARALFYLARTQKDLGESLTAIDTYKKYLEVEGNTFIDEKWQAAYDIAQLYRGLGEFEKMFEYCDLAEEIDARRCEHINLKAGVYFSQYKYEEAIKLYELSVSRPIPDVKLFLNPLEYTLNGKDQLVLSYYRNGEYDKAEKICEELSRSLKDYDQRILSNIWWCKTRTNMNIFLTLGNTPEPIWGGILETQGVHGVETTYIELAKGLQNLGHNVFLFCTTEKFHVYDGVNYIPFGEYQNYIGLNPDVIITSRWFDSFNSVPNAKKILWLQDASPVEKNYDFNKVDGVVVSSQWHADYLVSLVGQGIPKGKLKIIPLGIDKKLFQKKREKNKYKVLYSSNPNRGLDILGDMWGEITEKIPQIKLDILYGWNGLKTWRTDEGWKKSVEKEQESILEKFRPYSNITFKGRLTKKELAEEMLDASFLLYSCSFYETFSLTCFESQMAGMVVITSDMGALHTTVNDYGNYKIVGDPKSAEYKRTFIKYLVNTINDDKEFEELSNYNRKKALEDKNDWKDISIEWQKNIWKVLS